MESATMAWNQAKDNLEIYIDPTLHAYVSVKMKCTEQWVWSHCTQGGLVNLFATLWPFQIR